MYEMHKSSATLKNIRKCKSLQTSIVNPYSHIPQIKYEYKSESSTYQSLSPFIPRYTFIISNSIVGKRSAAWWHDNSARSQIKTSIRFSKQNKQNSKCSNTVKLPIISSLLLCCRKLKVQIKTICDLTPKFTSSLLKPILFPSNLANSFQILVMSSSELNQERENRLLSSDNEENDLDATVVSRYRIHRTTSESSLNRISVNLSNLEVTNSSKRNRSIESPEENEGKTSSVPKKLKSTVQMPPLTSEVVKNDFHIIDVVSYDDTIPFFNDAQGTNIYTAVLKELVKANDISKINFEDSFLDRGKYRYICSNVVTRDWLLSIIPTITPWGNAKIKSVNQGAPPNLIKYTAIMKKPLLEPNDIFTLMATQNPNLDTSNWRCSYRSKVEKGLQTWVINVDENSIPALELVDFKPYAGTKRIKLFLKK